MKGLVLAPQPFFTYRGTPFSVYYRAKAMAELGEELDLLTYGEGFDVDIPGVRVLRTPYFELLGKVKIGPSFLKLLYDIFMFFHLIALLTRNRYDYVHAHEEAAFLAAILKPFFRFRLIYDMHSSLPEQLNNFSFSRSKLLKKAFGVMERVSLRASDVVIAVCPTLLKYASQILGSKGHSVLIENSLYEPVILKSNQDIPRIPKEIERTEVRLREGKRLVVYAGTLEEYQGVDMLLESFRLICARQVDIYLLVLGGTRKQVLHYENLAESFGIGKYCDFTGHISQELAVRCNDMATMVVSPRRVGTNTPLKIYGQLASGVPVVATRIESHTQVLTDDIAFLADPNAEDFARAMQLVLDEPEKALQIAASAKQHYADCYSRPIYMQKIKNVLDLVEQSLQQKIATSEP